MALKRRKKTTAGGAAQAAPSSSKGGIKRRKNIPTLDSLPGELGDVTAAFTSSGDYGLQPVIMGSSRGFNAGFIPTGILSVDLALGGGFRRGRASMLYGERTSGKSTLSLRAIGCAHRMHPDEFVAYIDIEDTFDPKWAVKNGVDLDRLIVVKPESGEHAVDLADGLMRTKETSMVITDSIAMLVPIKEVNESSAKELPGLQARLVGKYVRRTTQAFTQERARGHNVTLIHINQWRMKIGVMFGDPRTLPGGKSLEFSTTQQGETKNKEHVKTQDGQEVVMFNEHTVKISKNKSGGPLREAKFKLVRTPHEGMHEGWIDQAKTFYNWADRAGFATGTAGSYEIEGFGKFKGKPAFTEWAINDPEAFNALHTKIVRHFQLEWDLIDPDD